MAMFPKMTVTLADGRRLRAEPDNRDAVRFDMLRTRLGWPTAGNAPVLWLTALAWSYLHRNGDIQEGPDDALDLFVEIETDEDPDAGEAPDPTTPAA